VILEVERPAVVRRDQNRRVPAARAHLPERADQVTHEGVGLVDGVEVPRVVVVMGMLVGVAEPHEEKPRAGRREVREGDRSGVHVGAIVPPARPGSGGAAAIERTRRHRVAA
jgi:hypothetical protein